MYGHFTNKIIADKDLIDTLLIVIKWTGCYQMWIRQVGTYPKDQRTNWIITKFLWKKKILQVKPLMSVVQVEYGIIAADEAADDTQYNA